MRWKGEWYGRVRGIEVNAFASKPGKRGSRGADAIGAKRIERDKKNVEVTLRFPASRQKNQPEQASGAAEGHGTILHDRSWLGHQRFGSKIRFIEGDHAARPSWCLR